MNKPEADLVQMRIFIQIFRLYFDKLTLAKWYLTWPLEIVRQKRWNCPILRKFQIQKSYLKVFDTFTSLGEAVSELKIWKMNTERAQLKLGIDSLIHGACNSDSLSR